MTDTETVAPREDARQEAPPPGPTARARALLWIGLLVVAIAIGVGLWLASRPPAEQLQGQVEADEINVATKTLARVDTLLVNEGDRVRAGQVLATLSAPEIVNGRQQAVAALDSARALESLAVEGARPEDRESLRSVWLAAQATADLAQVSSRRADRLYAEGVIAEQRRDEAHAARDSTARAAQAAKAQYDKALAGLRPQNRAIAAAQVRAASAATATADALVRETRLVSPIGGEVSRRLLNPGEIVSPILPAFQVIDIDHPHVTLNIREDDYRGMAMGRTLTGHVPALGRDLAFRVTRIAPQGSFATWRATRQSRGYDVRAFAITLTPTAGAAGLRPGMSVLFDWPR
ncbi:efflux RND transporter periplasmic adaptor subunit [Sphingomonadaceae bacterium jetA1]|jgi:HlyD family secretion protein|uniref:HlyD family secretion protein n=1 Tax=Facivitalis istanbulensis TaxID=3075838 RepID=UPI00349B3092